MNKETANNLITTLKARNLDLIVAREQINKEMTENFTKIEKLAQTKDEPETKCQNENTIQTSNADTSTDATSGAEVSSDTETNQANS